MSKYCLQHSPVPVIVVHPFYRRQHRKQKREKDPDRQSYIHLLKLAKSYNSSSDSILSPPSQDQSIPEISIDTPLDTPGTLSPDEDPPPLKKDEVVTVEEVTDEDRPHLTHAATDPTPLKRSFAPGDVSPSEKG